MSVLRIGLVGAGSMGANHARVVAASSSCELAVVVDPDEHRGRAIAETNASTWSRDLDGAGHLDAVIIAAATEYHRELALSVIGAGLPVLVEKPVCPSLKETEEVLTAAEAAGVPLMCGLLERYNPAVLTALAMVDEPLFVRAERHSPYAPRIRTGVAWDLLVHDVDLVVQLFGAQEPSAVSTEVGYFHPGSLAGAEDVVETSMRFQGGGMATVSASRIGQRKVRTLVIHEIDRMIEVDLLRRGVTAYRHASIEANRPGEAGYRQSTVIEVPEVLGREPLVTQLERFVQLVRGEVDADAERRSVLPAHRVVDGVLAGAAAR